MQVEYAGLKDSVTEPETGAMSQVSIFVATLPASNYIYAEAQSSENQSTGIMVMCVLLSFLVGW